jgi:hypothetical protein
MKKKDNPNFSPFRKGGRGDLKGIFCYLSETKDIPTEIEERMYRRTNGKNKTG